MAADILPTVTAGAIHTTVDMVGGTDGIVMIGIMADGVTVVDGVMTDMTLLAFTAADLVTVAGSKVTVVADSRDMAAEAIAADPDGHRISRTIV